MVVISPSAEIDIEGISSGISSENVSAAKKWLDGVQGIFEMLDAHPDVGEYRSEFSVQGCRSFTFGRYIIFFRRVAVGVEIARVIHGSRDLGII